MQPPLTRAGAHGLSYRPMTDDDLPFMAALYASTRAEEVARTGWPAAAQRAFLAQQFDAQHRHYRSYYPDAEWLVVERAGAPIGRLYIEARTDEVRIIDISLEPASRECGIGGAILGDVAEQARDLGAKVSIHVEKNNPAARLYRRIGFETVADAGVYDLMELRTDSADAS